MVVLAIKLELQHELKMKEGLTVKLPHNLEEILSRARSFVELGEENTHHWGNISRGRDLGKEVARRVKRDRSIVWDPEYQVQQSKA